MSKNDEILHTIRNCVLGFKCDIDWDAMRLVSTTTNLNDEESEIRFCSQCQKEVYESNSDEELLENIKLNRCVSFLKEDDIEIRLTGFTPPPRTE